ncbi:MAG: DUF3363 domain-containing protein [Pseudomonadota bacterium]
MHIARASRSGTGAFRAHLYYVQRDGVERDGGGGALYTRDGDVPDAPSFLERSGDDRHQFRIIVAPEDGDALGDLKETIRELMGQMEHDLGTRLDWVAVDHYNTGHPHTHIIVGGKDQRGKDLVIAPDYIRHGIRNRAKDIVTERLGPRRDVEIARSRYSEVQRDRFTGIDRALLADLADSEIDLNQSPSSGTDHFDQLLKRQRLSHLEGIGLATELENGRWRLKSGWDQELANLGRRNDVIATLAAQHGRDDRNKRLRMFEHQDAKRDRLIGTVLTGLPEDELKGTRSLVVEDFHGERWLVDTGEGQPGTVPPNGAIIEVGQRLARPRQSDRTIFEIARQNGGVYSQALHRETDPSSTSAYRQSHVRRLEALRRGSWITRTRDGVWHVPDDYLERVTAFEREQKGGVDINVQSGVPLENQITHHGVTWLDDQNIGELKDELSRAKRARQTWLREQGFLHAHQVELSEDARAKLARDEERRVVTRLENQDKRTPIVLMKFETFDGRYERPVDLAMKRLALIGNAKEFALVPWRPGLERHRGRNLTVRRTASGISWTLWKGRGISRLR